MVLKFVVVGWGGGVVGYKAIALSQQLRFWLKLGCDNSLITLLQLGTITEVAKNSALYLFSMY